MEKILVRRANVLLDISPEDKEYYKKLGYSVVDNDGNVVEEALSTDVHELQAQVVQLKAKLAEAEKTIADLKDAKKAKTKKTEE